jgi:hypothetical protein
MRKDALRLVIENEREVNKARKQVRAYEGYRPGAGSTGSRTFPCPKCGAPVVASDFGRKAHAHRMSGCAEVMEARPHHERR